MSSKRRIPSALGPLTLLFIAMVGCMDDGPVAPGPGPPRVSFTHFTTLPGELPRSNSQDAWSPLGKRFAYQRWNGSNYDLLVYDAEYPTNPPVLVHTGDFSRIVSWAPDAQWLLCVSQSAADRFTNFYSLVAFPVETGAAPGVLLSRAEVNWGVWGANGKIYWWDWTTVERRRLDPPSEWAQSNPGPFPDRTMILYLWDKRLPQGLRFAPYWFQSSLEEQGRFEYVNPDQLGPTSLVLDVFPNGIHFIAALPTACGVDAVVDRDGRLITKLWSAGCDDPPFDADAVTSDGRYIVGGSETDDNGRIVSRFLYLADASAAWRVPIEEAPQGWFGACSRTGFSLAYENFPQDSIYVGNLVITPASN